MTREGRSSNSASALAASREPVSHNTDAAIVALADYAARVFRCELSIGCSSGSGRGSWSCEAQ
jgi:hypothetical protein